MTAGSAPSSTRRISTTLRHLVDVPHDAIEALSSARCEVECATAGDTTRYTAVIEAPLGRRALMDVLYALAPYKAHGPDRFARVLDNWGIYDRAKTGGGASSGLFDQHVRSLGDNWRVFAEHRDVFFSTLAGTTGDYAVTPLITWQAGLDGKRRWDLGVVESDRNADALVGVVTLAYLQPELARNWPAWKPLVKGGKSNYIGPASVPMMALLHQRAILNSSRLVRAVEALDLDSEA